MSDKPKRNRWPAVVAVIVLYIASWGPAYWASVRLGLENELESALILAYLPIDLIYEYSPPPIKEPMRWYLIVGSGK